MNQAPDTAGYLHQEVLKKARYLVVTVDRYGLVAKQECPGIQWRFESLKTGKMLPDALQGVLESCNDSLAPQLFPYVHLSDDLIADIHVLNRGEDHQIILQDVSHGHDDEHRLQQKAHEVSLLLEQQAELNRMLDEKHREAEQASRAKSRFIAGMSHEFRSPIASIMAHAESLADQMPGQMEPAAIRRASWYLLTLVENLLEHARMGEGGAKLDLAVVEGKQVLEEMKALFAIQARSAGLEFELVNADGMHLVNADELRLRQVLVNLLSNALRYTKSGSIRLSLAVEGDNAVFSVIDTGAGIAEHDIESIFQPFTQLNRDGRGGAGLGLSISRQLVQDMGGSLEVKSAVGKGSEFTFTLPVANDEAKQDSLDGLRVLLVEDDEDISSIYCIWLADWGCEVVSVANCEQAREAYDAESTDIVLSDLFLEDGNGAELLRQLRQESNHLAAVICSGSDAGLLGQAGDETQSTILLSKPASAPRLRSALQAALRLARQA